MLYNVNNYNVIIIKLKILLLLFGNFKIMDCIIVYIVSFE